MQVIEEHQVLAAHALVLRLPYTALAGGEVFTDVVCRSVTITLVKLLTNGGSGSCPIISFNVIVYNDNVMFIITI